VAERRVEGAEMASYYYGASNHPGALSGLVPSELL